MVVLHKQWEENVSGISSSLNDGLFGIESTVQYQPVLISNDTDINRYRLISTACDVSLDS